MQVLQAVHDIVLIPEIPYDIDKVCEAIQKRNKAKKGFTILAVAEGAISKEMLLCPRRNIKINWQIISIRLYLMSWQNSHAADRRRCACDCSGTYAERSSPVHYDRVLSTRLGARAAQRSSRKNTDTW